MQNKENAAKKQAPGVLTVSSNSVQKAADIFLSLRKTLAPEERGDMFLLFQDKNVLNEESLERINYAVGISRPGTYGTLMCPSCMICLTERGQVEIRIYKCLNLVWDRVNRAYISPLDPSYIVGEKEGDMKSAYLSKVSEACFVANIGDDGKAWVYNPKPDILIRYYGNSPQGYKKSSRSWPMTLSDLAWGIVSQYGSTGGLEYDVKCALISAWSERSYLWRDILKDLEAGCSYASIPVTKIYKCHSKRELIAEHYGAEHAGRRTNKDNIGQSIFYARAHMLVSGNEIQKLYGFDPKGYKITN